MEAALPSSLFLRPSSFVSVLRLRPSPFFPMPLALSPKILHSAIRTPQS